MSYYDEPLLTRDERTWWLKVGCGIVAAVLLLSIAAGMVRFVWGWGSEPGRIYGVENVKEQWRFAYEGEESLRTAARIVCKAEQDEAAATSDNERIQRASARIAYEQNYYRIQADYDARMRNAFEAKLVKPDDVVSPAPSLEQMKAQECQ